MEEQHYGGVRLLISKWPMWQSNSTDLHLLNVYSALEFNVDMLALKYYMKGVPCVVLYLYR